MTLTQAREVLEAFGACPPGPEQDALLEDALRALEVVQHAVPSEAAVIRGLYTLGFVQGLHDATSAADLTAATADTIEALTERFAASEQALTERLDALQARLDALSAD